MKVEPILRFCDKIALFNYFNAAFNRAKVCIIKIILEARF